MAMSMATFLPVYFTLSVPKIGTLTTLLLATYDQVGYLADILEHRLRDGRQMDILGNQLKGTFKLACTLRVSQNLSTI